MSTAVANLPTYVQEKVGHAQLPAEYKAAVKAIRACDSIDIVKHYSDKADALAVMAKICKDDGLEREAKQLKLHTFRRMGTLADELTLKDLGSGCIGVSWNKLHKKWVAGIRVKGKQVQVYRGDSRTEAIRCRKTAEIESNINPKMIGSGKKLKEAGLRKGDVDTAAFLGRMSEKKFNKIVNAPSPPSPNATKVRCGSGTDAWKKLSYNGGIMGTRSFCRRIEPKELARALTNSEATRAREMVIEIQEWLDTFDQYLPQDVE